MSSDQQVADAAWTYGNVVSAEAEPAREEKAAVAATGAPVGAGHAEGPSSEPEAAEPCDVDPALLRGKDGIH